MQMDTWKHTSSTLHNVPRNIGTIPSVLNRQIPWGRVLVRSGFNATECGHYFNFSDETEGNRTYFKKILLHAGVGGTFDDSCCFYPASPDINEYRWLNTIEHNHGGAEGGKPGFNNIELQIMDTFMAGFTRWINFIGIASGNSCDGHGVKTPHIVLCDDSDYELLSRCLKLITPNTIHLVHKGRLRLQGPPELTIENIRPVLLDTAEALFMRRFELKNVFNSKL